jgi:hypothetical protein
MLVGGKANGNGSKIIIIFGRSRFYNKIQMRDAVVIFVYIYIYIFFVSFHSLLAVHEKNLGIM